MLTKDELYQVAAVIEGCLNSRPLWAQSDDPADPMPLTPAHFILAKPILPQPISEDVADRTENRLTLWGQRQKLHQQIWRRWQDEYLANMQVSNQRKFKSWRHGHSAKGKHSGGHVDHWSSH